MLSRGGYDSRMSRVEFFLCSEHLHCLSYILILRWRCQLVLLVSRPTFDHLVRIIVG